MEQRFQPTRVSANLSDRTSDLSGWLARLKTQFDRAALEQPEQIQPLQVLLEPEQQMIGDRVYEVAFIADPDGLPLEFVRVLVPGK